MIPDSSSVSRSLALGFVIARFLAAILLALAPLYLVLSSTSLSVNGMAVSADGYLLVERGFQVTPLLAALSVTIAIGLVDEMIVGKGCTRSFIIRSALTVGAAIILALAFAFASFAMIAILILTNGGAVFFPALPGLFLAFAFDLFLVMVFVLFLHSLTRRWYVTLGSLFIYAVLVIAIGTMSGGVDLIGFGTTPPVMVTGHSKEAIGTEAAWSWRIYWTLFAGAMLAYILAFGQYRSAAISNTGEPSPTSSKTRSLSFTAIATLVGLAVFTGYQLSLRKADVADRYQQGDEGLAEALEIGEPRPRLDRFSIELDIRSDARSALIAGHAELTNAGTEPITRIYLEKAQLLVLEDVSSDRIAKVRQGPRGRMVELRLKSALNSGESMRVAWHGEVDGSDPFDTPARIAVMPDAFFLNAATMLPLPRRASCFVGPKSKECRDGENYLLGDPALGEIKVSARSDLLVPGARRGADRNSKTEWVIEVSGRNLASFYVSGAQYRKYSIPGSSRHPAISIFAAPYSETDPEMIGRFAAEEFAALANSLCPLEIRDFWIAEVPPRLIDAAAYADGTIVSERFLGRRSREGRGLSEVTKMILGHEIGHQWIGFSLVPETGDGLALALEALTQTLALERSIERGDATREAIIQRERQLVRRARQLTGKNHEGLAAMEVTDWRAYHEVPVRLLTVAEANGQNMTAAIKKETCGTASQPPAELFERVIEELGISFDQLENDTM